MVGRAILWLALALGAVIIGLSFGFAIYALGSAALGSLVSLASQAGVLKAAWEHPASLVTLLLFVAGGIAALWIVVPRVARGIGRAAGRKSADGDDAARAVEEPPAA